MLQSRVANVWALTAGLLAIVWWYKTPIKCSNQTVAFLKARTSYTAVCSRLLCESLGQKWNLLDVTRLDSNLKFGVYTIPRH